MKDNTRVLENAHKIYYLAKVYEQDDMVHLSQMFDIPPIEFNAAAWYGQDLGLFAVSDSNKITLGDAPADFQFGELVKHLMEVLPFTIGKVNEKEAVIEEGYLSNWTAGFPQQDTIIAIKELIAQGVLAELRITDVDVIPLNREQRRARDDGKTEERIESEYIFYTLKENEDKGWHEKQFKDAKKLMQEQKQAK